MTPSRTCHCDALAGGEGDTAMPGSLNGAVAGTVTMMYASAYALAY